MFFYPLKIDRASGGSGDLMKTLFGAATNVFSKKGFPHIQKIAMFGPFHFVT